MYLAHPHIGTGDDAEVLALGVFIIFMVVVAVSLWMIRRG